MHKEKLKSMISSIRFLTFIASIVFSFISCLLISTSLSLVGFVTGSIFVLPLCVVGIEILIVSVCIMIMSVFY